jgi:ubiquitin carboxyl-terminal hydrolase MINDY-1/2
LLIAHACGPVNIAIVVRAFLQNTWSQLTYHGLFSIASHLEPGSLAALFRSSHLSVLYKSDGEDASLYTLVTDQAFVQEPSVVWERLEDIDGGWATFVDSDFIRSSPAGGDFPGRTAEATLRGFEAQPVIDPAEFVTAIDLNSIFSFR